MSKLMNRKRASKLAQLLQGLCYFLVGLAVLSVVLILIGRMEVNMTIPEGHYTNALLLEKDHSVESRAFLVDLSYLDLHVDMRPAGGKTELITILGIMIMGLVTVAPHGYSFYLIARFFGNVSNGHVFVPVNATLLLRCGAVLVAAALIAPILNGFAMPAIINLVTDNHISANASIDFIALIGGAIALVMAYVFHYGIYLQNEADHTL
ncbi:DUF2975 domain-containing protein [Paenibacillus sp. CAU 1782]